MDPLTNILYTMFLFFALGVISLLVITGIFFLFKAKQNRMTNLIFLGLSFLLVATGFIVNFYTKIILKLEGGFGNIIQEPFLVGGFTFFVLFTNSTFYKNRMKLAKIILIIVIILGSFQISMISVFGPIEIERGFEYYLRVSLDFPYALITFNWLSYSCYCTYKRIINMDIEPWIKMRYKLVAISSIIVSFYQFPEFFQPKGFRWGTPNDPVSLSIFGITTTLMMAYIVIFSIAWFMPKRLKHYFNRNYVREEEKECKEEDLLNYLKKKFKEK
ncbi:MAG: hypothetical protein JW891_09980 [Candidatus Lokiarchaeota archaeon]|nr:hypothetical protein [Candidatus Lokiarchaeota archaeon]